MFEPRFIFTSSPACVRAVPRLRRGAPIRSETPCSPPSPPCNRHARRLHGRIAAALITFLLPTILAFVPLVSFTTTAARACACGCSVFDVGGTGSAARERSRRPRLLRILEC